MQPTTPAEEEYMRTLPPVARSLLYKTELCRAYGAGQVCQYGDRCQFAHGKHELRSPPRHPKYKTELCNSFRATGKCQYGHKCRFVHDEQKYLDQLNDAAARGHPVLVHTPPSIHSPALSMHSASTHGACAPPRAFTPGHYAAVPTVSSPHFGHTGFVPGHPLGPIPGPPMQGFLQAPMQGLMQAQAQAFAAGRMVPHVAPGMPGAAPGLGAHPHHFAAYGNHQGAPGGAWAGPSSTSTLPATAGPAHPYTWQAGGSSPIHQHGHPLLHATRADTPAIPPAPTSSAVPNTHGFRMGPHQHAPLLHRASFPSARQPRQRPGPGPRDLLAQRAFAEAQSQARVYASIASARSANEDGAPAGPVGEWQRQRARAATADVPAHSAAPDAGDAGTRHRGFSAPSNGAGVQAWRLRGAGLAARPPGEQPAEGGSTRAQLPAAAPSAGSAERLLALRTSLRAREGDRAAADPTPTADDGPGTGVSDGIGPRPPQVPAAAPAAGTDQHSGAAENPSDVDPPIQPVDSRGSGDAASVGAAADAETGGATQAGAAPEDGTRRGSDSDACAATRRVADAASVGRSAASRPASRRPPLRAAPAARTGGARALLGGGLVQPAETPPGPGRAPVPANWLDSAARGDGGEWPEWSRGRGVEAVRPFGEPASAAHAGGWGDRSWGRSGQSTGVAAPADSAESAWDGSAAATGLDGARSVARSVASAVTASSGLAPFPGSGASDRWGALGLSGAPRGAGAWEGLSVQTAGQRDGDGRTGGRHPAGLRDGAGRAPPSLSPTLLDGGGSHGESACDAHFATTQSHADASDLAGAQTGRRARPLSGARTPTGGGIGRGLSPHAVASAASLAGTRAAIARSNSSELMYGGGRGDVARGLLALRTRGDGGAEGGSDDDSDTDAGLDAVASSLARSVIGDDVDDAAPGTDADSAPSRRARGAGQAAWRARQGASASGAGSGSGAEGCTVPGAATPREASLPPTTDTGRVEEADAVRTKQPSADSNVSSYSLASLRTAAETDIVPARAAEDDARNGSGAPRSQGSRGAGGGGGAGAGAGTSGAPLSPTASGCRTAGGWKAAPMNDSARVRSSVLPFQPGQAETRARGPVLADGALPGAACARAPGRLEGPAHGGAAGGGGGRRSPGVPSLWATAILTGGAAHPSTFSTGATAGTASQWECDAPCGSMYSDDGPGLLDSPRSASTTSRLPVFRRLARE